MSSPAMARRRAKRRLREVFAGIPEPGLALHYDRTGRAIPVWRWAWLFEDFKGYRRIARTQIGTTEVSTIWDGLDSDGFIYGGPPRVFETGVNRDGTWDIIGRWPSEAAALAGHEAAAALQAQLEP
jgi:hypothetical protein